ncbi:hypothetical protein L915_01194, partial [Phytophthora nicotianae]
FYYSYREGEVLHRIIVEENGIVYVKVYIQKRCQEEYVVYSGKGDTRELH